jgi:hypothetical protein
MNTQAPRVATWLAERFLTGRRGESLIGDLMEQYREGRSVAWYWGQVLRAIVASITEELSAHKLLALRALGLGIALDALFSIPVGWLSGMGYIWLANVGVSCDQWGGAFWCQFWMNQFSAELLAYIACALNGGIVARLHRPHGIAAVCLFSVALLLFNYGMSLFFGSNPPPAEMSVSLTTVRVVSFVSMLGRSLAVLMGGLSGARSEHAAAAVD